MFWSHQDEEHRNMRPFANSVPIEVGTDAHPIAVGTGVKWRAIETNCLSSHSISVSPSHIGDLPNEDPICGFTSMTSCLRRTSSMAMAWQVILSCTVCMFSDSCISCDFWVSISSRSKFNGSFTSLLGSVSNRLIWNWDWGVCFWAL